MPEFCKDCGESVESHHHHRECVWPAEEAKEAARVAELEQKLESMTKERDAFRDETVRQRKLISDLDTQWSETQKKLTVANLQNNDLKSMLNDIRGMILGARTVHEISELACRIMRRIEGPDEDPEKRSPEDADLDDVEDDTHSGGNNS